MIGAAVGLVLRQPSPAPPSVKTAPPQMPALVTLDWKTLATTPIHVVEPEFDVQPEVANASGDLHWISADLHLHSAQNDGTDDRDLVWTKRYVERAHLQVAPVLLWGDQIDMQQVRRPIPSEKPSPVMEWGFETSGQPFGTLGHAIVLGPIKSIADWSTLILHPTGVPLLDWVAASDVPLLAGMAHVSGWQEGPIDIEHSPGAPFELPIHAANGRLAFVTFESVPGASGESDVLWKRLQNSGIRLPLTAGTDFPCNDQTAGTGPGWHRTYVLVPKRWTYADFLSAIRAGRTTIATGWTALLDVTAGRARVGDELSIRSGQSLPLSIASILEKDEEVRIIANGEERARVKVAAGKHTTPVSLRLEKSAWVYVRTATAMTSPLYVLVDGKPIRPNPGDPCFLSKYVRSLEKAVAMRSSELGAFKGTVFAAYDRAEAFYLKRAREAGGGACE